MSATSLAAASKDAAPIDGAPAADGAESAVAGGMGRTEFILLIAALMSMIALSVDIMLPALPRIEADLPGATAATGEGYGAFVIFALILGMSATPIPVGLLADAYGRRAPLVGALAVFCVGGLICAAATDFETLLVGRFLQGAGVVGPRIIATAIVRDRFEGRRMASVMSVVMMIFIAVPAVAPALGLGVEKLAGWRGVFVALCVLSAALMAWIVLRLPETLPPEKRRPIKRAVVWSGLGAVFTRRRAIGAIVASGAFFSAFLAYIGTAQRVFAEIYRFGDSFVFVFSFLALFIGGASFVNARIVERVGVRRVLGAAVGALIAVCGVAALAFGLTQGPPRFELYAIWCAAMAFAFGLAFGNINALAMHFLGDLAGLGAAVMMTVQNFLATIGAALIAGLVVDDPTPLVVSFFVCGVLCLAVLKASDPDGVAGRASL